MEPNTSQGLFGNVIFLKFLDNTMIFKDTTVFYRMRCLFVLQNTFQNRRIAEL
jgi:hypothetical protein